MVLHHLMGRGMMLDQWARMLPVPANRFLSGAYLAVQTFFVLSGFVLAQTYGATRWNRRTLAQFGIARIARIYPVYLLSLAVVGGFAVEMLSQPGRTAIEKAGLVGDYGFILIGWQRPLGVGWNTPAWSLSCELFFYLCFPALFVVLRNAGLRRILCALALSSALPLLLSRIGVPEVWKPVYHLADFICGIAAARLLEVAGRNGFLKRSIGPWLYLPALAVSFLLIALDAHNLDAILRPMNVLIIIGLARGGGLGAGILSTPVAEYLGQVSYAVYILHVPLLWWYSRYGFERLGPPLHTTTTLAYLTLVIAVSILAFELVEKPANRWLRVRLAPRTA